MSYPQACTSVRRGLSTDSLGLSARVARPESMQRVGSIISIERLARQIGHPVEEVREQIQQAERRDREDQVNQAGVLPVEASS